MKYIYVNNYGFALALLFATVLLVALFQIIRIIYYRHDAFHYQFIFLLCNGLWAILKFTFWLFFGYWDEKAVMLLQGVSMLIQFATFSLLVLFYIQIIYKAQRIWNKYKKRSYLLYGCVNALFLILFTALVTCEFVCTKESILNSILGEIEAFYVSIMYFILSILLAIYAWKLRDVMNNSNVKIPFFKVNLQIAVTATLVLVFVSRSIVDFLSGLDVLVIYFPDPDGPIDIIFQIELFFMMFVWEILPASLVIVLFWRVPNSKKTITTVLQPNYSTININSAVPSYLGNTKYDSEESEDERMKRSLTSASSSGLPTIFSPYSTLNSSQINVFVDS